MAAVFDVSGTSILEDRKLFAVKGVIRSGMVRTGMDASLEEAGEAFSEPVHGVEHLEPTGDDGGHELALLFCYGSREKLESWRFLPWEGRSLSLSWRRARG